MQEEISVHMLCTCHGAANHILCYIGVQLCALCDKASQNHHYIFVCLGSVYSPKEISQ